MRWCLIRNFARRKKRKEEEGKRGFVSQGKKKGKETIKNKNHEKKNHILMFLVFEANAHEPKRDFLSQNFLLL